MINLEELKAQGHIPIDATTGQPVTSEQAQLGELVGQGQQQFVNAPPGRQYQDPRGVRAPRQPLPGQRGSGVEIKDITPEMLQQAPSDPWHLLRKAFERTPIPAPDVMADPNAPRSQLQPQPGGPTPLQPQVPQVPIEGVQVASPDWRGGAGISLTPTQIAQLKAYQAAGHALPPEIKEKLDIYLKLEGSPDGVPPPQLGVPVGNVTDETHLEQIRAQGLIPVDDRGNLLLPGADYVEGQDPFPGIQAERDAAARDMEEQIKRMQLDPKNVIPADQFPGFENLNPTPLLPGAPFQGTQPPFDSPPGAQGPRGEEGPVGDTGIEAVEVDEVAGFDGQMFVQDPINTRRFDPKNPDVIIEDDNIPSSEKGPGSTTAGLPDPGFDPSLLTGKIPATEQMEKVEASILRLQNLQGKQADAEANKTAYMLGAMIDGGTAIPNWMWEWLVRDTHAVFPQFGTGAEGELTITGEPWDWGMAILKGEGTDTDGDGVIDSFHSPQGLIATGAAALSLNEMAKQWKTHGPETVFRKKLMSLVHPDLGPRPKIDESKLPKHLRNVAGTHQKVYGFDKGGGIKSFETGPIERFKGSRASRTIAGMFNLTIEHAIDPTASSAADKKKLHSGTYTDSRGHTRRLDKLISMTKPSRRHPTPKIDYQKTKLNIEKARGVEVLKYAEKHGLYDKHTGKFTTDGTKVIKPASSKGVHWSTTLPGQLKALKLIDEHVRHNHLETTKTKAWYKNLLKFMAKAPLLDADGKPQLDKDGKPKTQEGHFKSRGLAGKAVLGVGWTSAVLSAAHLWESYGIAFGTNEESINRMKNDLLKYQEERRRLSEESGMAALAEIEKERLSYMDHKGTTDKSDDTVLNAANLPMVMELERSISMLEKRLYNLRTPYQQTPNPLVPQPPVVPPVAPVVPPPDANATADPFNI